MCYYYLYFWGSMHKSLGIGANFMIETIHSKESGDKGTNKVTNSFKMPKNIRQVGKSSAIKKIYVEDYVMTYIRQLTGEDYTNCKVAVLVGQYIKNETSRNIFITGAIEVENIEVANEIIFSNDAWTDIYEKIKKYFSDVEIVGWFLGGPGYFFEDKEKILKTHVDNFAGQDKTLLTYDNMEKEETFMVYENGGLTKQEGYYIYYEKNEEMQNYMIDQNKSPREEEAYDDRVAREIRTVIQNKKSSTDESRGITRVMYAAGTLLAVIILVVGAAMLDNYEQMKLIQNTLDYLTDGLEEVQSAFNNHNPPHKSGENPSDDVQEVSGSDIRGEESENLDVDIIPGNVNPIENEEDDNEKPASDNELVNEEPTITPTKAPIQDSAKEVKYYTVESGDTLAGISFKLYNSGDYIALIKELNGIEDENKIYVGQRLIVP